jgi:paraquat-inducible protein B
MNAKANYFKLGMFILVSVGLIVVGVIILGAGALNKKLMPMETYIEGSAQGLTVGAPVKFRGVQIGRVDKIGFAGATYKQPMTNDDPMAAATRSYVMIEFSIHPDMLSHSSVNEAQFPSFVFKEVERGLRARLATVGITGNAYLDLDYYPPTIPTLALSWSPRTIYIPSTPAQITRIIDSAESILNQVENAGIPKIAAHIDALILDTNKQIDSADLPGIRASALTTLSELRESNAALKKLLENPRIQEILDQTNGAVVDTRAAVVEAKGAVEDVRRIINSKEVEAFRSDLPQISARIKLASDNLNAILTSEHVKRTLEGLSTSTSQFPGTLAQLDRALKHVDLVISSQQTDIATIVRNLRTLSDNLDQVSENAKQHPSGLIFGEPPPKLQPGK